MPLTITRFALGREASTCLWDADHRGEGEIARTSVPLRRDADNFPAR